MQEAETHHDRFKKEKHERVNFKLKLYERPYPRCAFAAMIYVCVLLV